MKILPTLHLTNLLAKPLIPSQVHRAWPIILLLGLGGPVLTTAEEVPLLEDPISNPNDATFADDLNFADDEISADLPHLSGHLVHEEDVDIF
ncbi:MAG: hypothetical protein J6Y94_05035, partial [Bacteriovoracaceae bacterium]|nr:hypothetical protein [Bacteriovoracaceae bacterium]